MQTVRVRTTQNVFIEHPVASLGDRILAYLVDRGILILYTMVVAVVLMSRQANQPQWWLVVLGAPWIFYNLLFEIFMNGQSPGKRLFKIKVVRLNGTPATISDYLLRWIFSFVDYYVLSGAIAVVIIAMGGKGQRLGDVVAGTSVVKLIEQDQVTANQIFVGQDDDHVPTFHQVSQLSGSDIELIQRALEANRDLGNVEPVMAVTQKIKGLLEIESDLPPVKFLYTVIKDYNTLTIGRQNG